LSLETQRLFGCDFVSTATMPEVVAHLLDGVEADGDRWECVVTPNVDHLVRYERDPRERAVAGRATLTLPDGMPIVWASRAFRRPLRRRLPGSDLFESLWPELARREVPTVVAASSAEVASLLAVTHPRLRCVSPPMFSVDDEHAVEAVLAAIDAACAEIDARVLFVGLSMEKHHFLAGRLDERWRAGGPARSGRPTVLLVGASAELYLGIVPRSPRWMQRVGLEWLHRLRLDPHRMWRRYLVDDVAFLRLLWHEHKGSRRPAAGSGAAPQETVG
jgi:N-acetylglucosaminyldiphosphoundecaprenol N-acetyl-beta-D-mannosaminyltransferase